jgi:hypothetical protein
MYELRYVEGLRPVKTPESLEVGSTYHKKLERLYNGDFDVLDEDYSRESAMVLAYHKYIYPHFKVVEAEKWIEYDLLDGDKLVGQIDAIAEDGRLVEHKTTGSEITEQYEYNLLWDEQVLAYMLMTGKREVWYTICRKPTIRQRQSESDDAFFSRMVAWYDDDTESKIRLLRIERTDAEVAQFKDDLLAMVQEMKHTGLFYKNTCNCNMYGCRCEYSSICLHYDPNQMYLEFERSEEYEGNG